MLRRVCAPVLVSPAFFILVFLLFCALDAYSIIQSGFFPLVIVVSGFLFCYLLILPCSFLPYVIRKMYKAFLLVIGVIYFAINLGMLFLYRITINHNAARDMLSAILATNPDEMEEYLSTYISSEIVVYVLSAMTLLLIIFYALNRVSFKMHFVPRLLLFIFLLFSAIVSIYKYRQITDLNVIYLINTGRVPDLNDYRQNPMVVTGNSLPDNVVLIIGESFSKSHSSLYGYEKPTNPKLCKMQSDSLLKVFSDISCYAINTIPNVKAILTSYVNEYADSINWYECLTLIEVIKNAGYKTYWISNQSKRGMYDNEVGRFAELCDVEYFVGDKYAGMSRKNFDEELLPLVDLVNDGKDKKNFLIIQLMGSHSVFKQRYPAIFSKFSPVDYNTTHPQLLPENKQLLAEYDNSVLYNDSVVYEIMQRFADKEAVVFYFSDHALDIFESCDEYIGHARGYDENSVFYGKQIPFMVYTTKKFRNKYPFLEERVSAAVDMPYRTDSIMYTIMDVAGIETVDGVSYKAKSLFK